MGVGVEEEGFVVHQAVLFAGAALEEVDGLREEHGAVGVQEEAGSARDGGEVGQVLPQRMWRCRLPALPGDVGVQPQDCAGG